MSELSNAIWNGVGWGLHNTTNILFGGLTSRAVSRSGLDPFDTLYVNLESQSGFSSWAHPAYATPMNVALNSAGIDTTWAPLTSSITNSFLGYGSNLFGGGLFGGGLFGGGLFGGGLFGGGLFGYGFPTTYDTYISSYTTTPLGVKPGFHGWF